MAEKIIDHNSQSDIFKLLQGMEMDQNLLEEVMKECASFAKDYWDFRIFCLESILFFSFF